MLGIMTKQEFIFSDDRRHRIIRHLTFWAIWWFTYFLFFHLPLHAISGWNLSELNVNMRDNGTWWILKMLFFNSLLAVVIPQILFTYTLLYYILPKYFYQKRNLLVIAAALTVFLIVYVVISACFKPIALLPNYWMGIRKTFPWPNVVAIFAALRDTLTSLPIIAGIALAIKLMKRWWLKDKETQQIAGEKIKAELQLLKAQIHPHFLFNTLNNIYCFTLSGSAKAPEMIKKLSDLLNYILNECKVQWVPLEREIKMIEDYMALERIRYGEQMDMTVELPTNFGSEEILSERWMVAPLLLIPFVENSFKHGASKMLKQPFVKLRISVEKNRLHFFITNSRPPVAEIAPISGVSAKTSGNIGLKNVKKRLQLLYPDTHELTIIQEPENYSVYLNIKLQRSEIRIEDQQDIKQEIAYDGA